jgi:hypothetical protein
MRQFRTAARRVGVTAALITIGALTAASPAAAQPADCHARLYASSGTVVAYCDEGNGQYRASTRCDKSWAPDYNRYGPWRTAGGTLETSIARCDGSDRAFNAGYQTR